MDTKLVQLTLTLPLSFRIPSEYSRTTPEENAAIVLLGVSLLEQLRADGYSERMEDLKRQLREESATNQNFRQSMATLDEYMGAKVEEAVDRSFSTITDRVEELAKEMVSRDKAERQANLVTIGKERDIIERRVTNINHVLDRLSELSGKIDSTRLLSSTKGRTNENNSRQLIIDTFGTPGSRFTLHRREDFSGDHIFDWNGLRIMWEDKDYARTVSKVEVDKGLRDFNANRDCHVLLFVSAHTAIAGHESSSGIECEVRNGKLLMFISSFKDNLDPAGYIRTVIQTILSGLGPLILQEDGLDPVEDERLRMLSTVLASISQSLYEQEKAFDSFLSDIKIKVASMKNGLSRTKHGIDKIITDITGSLPTPARASHGADSAAPATDLSIAGRAAPEASSSGAAAANSSEQTAEVKKQRKCGKCGEPGHIKSNCPN